MSKSKAELIASVEAMAGKLENKGKTEQGKFSAAEFNDIQALLVMLAEECATKTELINAIERLPIYTQSQINGFLANKANKSEVETALAGKQATILDLDNIRSGAAAGATAVQPATLQTELAGKQNVISDLSTIRSGAAAGATAVQPATLQTELAGKQNVISDLSTIRSGAAAGATAVQPATLQSGLATKQDVLVFDETPTAGSNNPVKSKGIKTYVDSSDSTLSTQIGTKADKIAQVDHGTSDTTFTLTPNVLHVWGEVTSLNLSLGTGENGKVSEYMFQFYSGNTPTTLTLPNSVIWVQPLTTQAGKTYQVSIVNNLAAYITDGMAAAESSGGTPTYATEAFVTSLIDTYPTADSSNVAGSGGTYAMIEGKIYY